MKKILHIIPSFNLGGEEKFLLDIYPFLSKKFHHIVCPFFHVGELYSETEHMTMEKYRNSTFWIYIFKSREVFAKILKPLLFFYYSYRVFSILKKENPDAIITYTTLPDLPLALRAALFNKNRNFKWYSRVCFQTDRIMFFPSFSYNVNHDRFYKKIIYTMLLPIMHFHIKLLVKHSDCVIVINDFSKNEISKLCQADINKFFLMPVCLQPNSISHNVLDQKLPYFIAAGRLEHVKGFDFLIKTFSQFSENNPAIKLIIYGEGSARSSLEKLIQSLKLSEKVFLPGYVKNPALTGKNAIAYIIPSRSEAFGKIIIEAMQARGIVVSSDCVGPKEIITNNIDGLLFECVNSVALLKALQKVMRMSEESKMTLKENAYQRSLVFQPERVAAVLNEKLEKECC